MLAGVCPNHVQHVYEEPKQEPQAKKLKTANAQPAVSKSEPTAALVLQLLKKQSASSSAQVDLGAVAAGPCEYSDSRATFDPYFNSGEDDAGATAANASSSSVKNAAKKGGKGKSKAETGPKSGTAKPQEETKPSAAKCGGRGRAGKNRTSTVKAEPAN